MYTATTFVTFLLASGGTLLFPDGDPSQLPPVNNPAIQPKVAAGNSLWQPATYLPTNDWMEPLATSANSQGIANTGLYAVSLGSDKRIRFQPVKDFLYHDTDLNNGLPTDEGILQTLLHEGIILGEGQSLNTTPVVLWSFDEVGNLLRTLHYTNCTVQVCQGSLFQSATYAQGMPNISVGANSCSCKDPDGVLITTSSGESIKRWTLASNTGISYCLYSTPSLQMHFNSQTGQFTLTSGPYSGSISFASMSSIDLPNNQSLLDDHSCFVVTKASGSLGNSQYSFDFSGQNLDGTSASSSPLILLTQPQVAALQPGTFTQENYACISNMGNLTTYEGAHFTFSIPRAPTEDANMDPIPNLPNGETGVTQAQAIALLNDPYNFIANGIAYANNAAKTLFQNNIYAGGKVVYMVASTLAATKQLMTIAGWSQSDINNDPNVQNLRQELRALVPLVQSHLQWETGYKTVVADTNDYDQADMLNDHIVDYGYLLQTMNILSADDPSFLSSLSGCNRADGSPITHGELGDMLYKDISESLLNEQTPPFRNFDIYCRHSWISGIVTGPNGMITESQAEVLIGARAARNWLHIRQATGNLESEDLNQVESRYGMERVAYQSYYQNTPSSVYQDLFQYLDPDSSAFPTYESFAKDHPYMGWTGQQITGALTWFGNYWDRYMGINMMGVSPYMMDVYFNGVEQAYVDQTAQFVCDHWDNYDDIPLNLSPMQANLIGIVSRASQVSYHDTVYRAADTTGHNILDLTSILIQDVQTRSTTFNFFDPSTSPFLLYLTAIYQQNANQGGVR